MRSGSNEALWAACRDRFLDEIEGVPGPGGFPSHLWVAHRLQRDALFEAAADRGIPGWLGPPVAFLSELHDRFGIRDRPVGHLTGRLLVARIASRSYRRAGLGRERPDRGPARSHVLDALFSELLPEGVDPERLRAALEALGGDEFALRRNAWVADSYEEFLGELARRDRYDPRSIHAMVADAVQAGGLPAAIGGASRLHVYGLTSLRGRRRLFEALAAQEEVEAIVYLPREEGKSEWDALPGASSESVPSPTEPRGGTRVVRAPDALGEGRWVASQVKAILLAAEAEPHEIAVVARSGAEDTRRILVALEAVGVPATARVRTALADVAALRAVLSLFRAAADGWTWSGLRPVLASPYFDVDVDLRPLDVLARQRRIRGLDVWRDAWRRLSEAAAEETRAGALAAEGVYADRLAEDGPRFAAFAANVADLSDERREVDWVDLTLAILEGRRFDFRARLSRPAGDRWDIVRLDQRGTEALRVLLREWREIRPGDERFGADAWHDRLRRLLEANEIALTTPLRRGVQVLEAHEAALHPFRRTFVIHANDGVFPRPHRNRGVFSDEEADRLRELGLPVGSREDTIRREAALWNAVTAQPWLTVSWRSASADGTPALPTMRVPDAPRSVVAAGAAAGGTEEAGGPLSAAQRLEWEAARLDRARRDGDGTAFASIAPDVLRQATLAAYAEELRTGGLDGSIGPDAPRPASLRPHPWNGELRDPFLLAWLRWKFDDGHVWSASQLEQYGRRPFDFLLERVLRLRAAEEAEESTSPSSRGALAHGILERFFTRLGTARPAELASDARALFEEVATEAFERAESAEDVWLGEAALWAVTREQVREEVRAFLERELPWLAGGDAWPERLELGFGDTPAEALRLRGEDVWGRPASLLARGRIDRVDATPGRSGRELRVLDYKWRSLPAAGGYKDGSVLQTALYLRAVEAAGLDGHVAYGAYRPIAGTTREGAKLPAARAEGPLRFALSIPARVRAGRFEAVQAKAIPLAPWQAGRDVTRSDAKLAEGSRFEEPAPGPEAGSEPPPGAESRSAGGADRG
ncbi:MAG: PD-(D/E)XK nuclease family protein [Gemmatimonadota bacterium]